MTDQTPPTEPPRYWSQSASAARWQREHDTPVRRFIGGSPLGVFIKLVVVSFIVGALLVMLKIRPVDVFNEVSDLINWVYLEGLRSFRDFGNYIVAGAAIVVPVWLLMRLLSYRGR